MSFTFSKGKRFYKQVAGSTTETEDYIPASGEKIFIVNLGCSSSSTPDTVTCIVWDADGTPEILMSSYNEARHDNVNIEIVGDGIKVLRICLINDLTEPTYMGGFWEGTEQ